jgi:acetate---CoA ligase (ADP-forming)
MHAAAVLVLVHHPLLTTRTVLDTAEMIRGIKGYRSLTGYRRHLPTDLKDLEEILLRVSRLVEEIPEISELDLNPIFALPPSQGCKIVDARILVRRAVSSSTCNG